VADGPAVDAIYADPPRATLQILQPELYFEHRTQLVGHRSQRLSGGAARLEQRRRRHLRRDADQANHPAQPWPERAGNSIGERWTGDRMIVLQKHDALTYCGSCPFRDDDSASRLAHLQVDSGQDLRARHGASLAMKDSSVLIAIGDGARQIRSPCSSHLARECHYACRTAPPTGGHCCKVRILRAFTTRSRSLL